MLSKYFIALLLKHSKKMAQRPRQRSKTEIMTSILRSTNNRAGMKISQILYEYYIPYNQLKEYLTMMVQNKLIIYVKEEKIFKITEYGVHVLKIYDEMDRLLVYDSTTKQSVEK
jgi:predicted transcriptional regulator